MQEAESMNRDDKCSASQYLPSSFAREDTERSKKSNRAEWKSEAERRKGREEIKCPPPEYFSSGPAVVPVLRCLCLRRRNDLDRKRGGTGEGGEERKEQKGKGEDKSSTLRFFFHLPEDMVPDELTPGAATISRAVIGSAGGGASVLAACSRCPH